MGQLPLLGELTKFRVFTMVISVGVGSFKTNPHLRNYNVIEKVFCIQHPNLDSNM
jgi:hypothetical protein